ncbi:MAG TPA: DUF4870 domain-containing protein [Pirellulaceae bacterium]|nr:DUF4870 domain-containing protein [Pirellulaceae bacterium]
MHHSHHDDQGGPAANSEGRQSGPTSQQLGDKPDTVMCILSYFGVFALVPFFVKKDDEFISWHARQGVVLMIFWMGLYVTLFMISMIPIINLLAYVASMLVGVGGIALSIYCMIQACQGNKWPIPVLSNFVHLLPSAK